jgi:hypothetical protein
MPLCAYMHVNITHTYTKNILSVRNVVPTLTSTSAEIYLSMTGAKQHDDTDFILVTAMGRTFSRGALKVLYCVAPLCLQRRVTSVTREEVRPLGP